MLSGHLCARDATAGTAEFAKARDGSLSGFGLGRITIDVELEPPIKSVVCP